MPWHLNLNRLSREPHHHGEEPRVPLQRSRAGSPGAREDAVRRDAGGAGRLGLCSEGAAGETRHRHEAGDGAEVCGEEAELMMMIGFTVLCYYSLIFGYITVLTYSFESLSGFRSSKISTAKKEKKPVTCWNSRGWWVPSAFNRDVHHLIYQFKHACFDLNLVFFQDYESKLEALQRQVDSRYLESPEEEEEPEEEGDTVTFYCLNYLNQAALFSSGQNVFTRVSCCALQCRGRSVRLSWLCGRSENGVSTSSPLSGTYFGATPSSSKRLMLSVWSWRKR